MKTWRPRARWVEDLALRAARRDAAGDPPLPPDVEKWLAQLSLLHGVPFSYLVPDWRMLPAESIRFFVLDPNWIERLVDGALSIAQTSTIAAVHLERIRPAVQVQVARAALRIRSERRGVAAPDQAVQGGTISGLLLRSAVVSGWPGLEVRGYAGGPALPIVRMDRPSPDVLFVLFNGVPTQVDLTEPPEGLHFGVITTAGRAKGRGRAKTPPVEQMVVDLRYLGVNAGQPAGQPIPKAFADVPTRSGGYANVLDVATLQATLQDQLTQLNALGPEGFGAAEFAIQMVKSAELQSYGHSSSRARRSNR